MQHSLSTGAVEAPAYLASTSHIFLWSPPTALFFSKRISSVKDKCPLLYRCCFTSFFEGVYLFCKAFLEPVVAYALPGRFLRHQHCQVVAPSRIVPSPAAFRFCLSPFVSFTSNPESFCHVLFVNGPFFLPSFLPVSGFG